VPEERKLVTVLFADVVDSSGLGLAHDPEIVRGALGRVFEAASESLEAHGGTVEKFIGDAVMAVFGVPVAHEDDADRAVRAAFALKRRVQDLDRAAGVALEVRIGVNTGEAVTGTSQSRQFLVTGTAVNVAARLQQTASPGEILVGALTHQLTKAGVRYGSPRAVDAKGLGRVEAWPAAALESALPEQHRGLPDLRAPFIGRDRELRLLQETLARVAAEGAPSLVTVLGPPGAGKSRLTTEFVRAVGAERVRIGRCLPYGEGITFYPLQLILRAEAGIEPADAHADAHAKLHAAVAVAFRDDPAEGEAVAARTAVVAGLADPQEVLPHLRDAELREELSWGVRRFFERRAAARPLVLVFEDIHWAEPTLLDLIEHLAEWSRAPLLLLCLARPELRERRPGFGSSIPNVVALSLAPLAPEDTRRLIAELLAIEALPEPLRVELVSRSEGNPLYVEEFLRVLIETGRIGRSDGRWVATQGIASLEVPPTLQGLITARLDAAAPELKRLLQLATLPGRLFTTEALAALAGEAPPTDLLRDAVRRDLLVEADERALGEGRVYRFKHALIRDVAYSTLPKAERTRLHDAYARWLEETLGDRKEELADVVAYHAEQAFRYGRELDRPDADDLGRRALALLLLAATRARRRADERAAHNLYERAAAVADVRGADPRSRAEAHAFAALYRSWTAPATPEIGAALDAALALAEDAGPSEALVLLLGQLGWRAWGEERPDEAQRLWDRAYAVAREIGDPELVADELVARAQQALFARAQQAIGDLRPRRALLLEARAYMTATGARRALPWCLRLLASTALREGDYAGALAFLQEARAALPADGSKLMQAIDARHAADHAFHVGDLAEADRLGEEALGAARAAGSRTWILLSLWGLAEALLEAGDLPRADALLREAVALVEQSAFRGYLPEVHGRCARVAVRTGNLVAARAHADTARRAAVPTDITAVQIAGVAEAEVAEAEGDPDRAELAFVETLRLAGSSGYRDKLAQTRVAYGEFLMRRGRWEEARTALGEARDFYADPVAHRRREAIEALLRRCEAQVSSRSGGTTAQGAGGH